MKSQHYDMLMALWSAAFAEQKGLLLNLPVDAPHVRNMMEVKKDLYVSRKRSGDPGLMAFSIEDARRWKRHGELLVREGQIVLVRLEARHPVMPDLDGVFVD
jgi:hypothetical protein